jgi:hypothetical protein
MVEMSMRDDNHGDVLRDHVLEEGQGVGILLVDHEATVEHDLLGVYGEDETGTTHLAPRAQR